MTRFNETIRKFYHTAIPLPLKYGASFQRKFKFYLEHQCASRDEIEAYRWQRLQALVDYAYEHVPYYRTLFEKQGIHPGDIKSLSDFRKIPTLHKQDVITNREQLKSDEFAKFHVLQTTTSATTRDGMVMYRSQEAETARHAIVWRFWHNLGYRFRDPRVHLTLANHEREDYLQPHVDLNENCLQFDPRAITLANASRIYRRIKEFRPQMIFAQPSNLATLVHYWRVLGLSEFEIPLCLVLGEKVYPEYRDLITGFLGDNLRQYYGNRENTASAGELSDGRLYINSDFVHLEFENDDGSPVAGKPGNIISTGFENYAFPLIRYHTEDVGSHNGYPENGLVGFDTMEIVGGRGRDLLLSRDGLFCPNVVVQLKEANFHNYNRVQLEQTAIDHLIIRLEPNSDFDHSRDVPVVEEAYRKYFKGRFTVEVEVVAKIAATPAFKHKLVISQLALDELRKQTHR